MVNQRIENTYHSYGQVLKDTERLSCEQNWLNVDTQQDFRLNCSSGQILCFHL